MIPAEFRHGSVATEDEIAANKAMVLEYVARVEDYLTCVKALLEENWIEPHHRTILTDRYNYAVLERQFIVSLFNEQVRTFNEPSAAD